MKKVCCIPFTGLLLLCCPLFGWSQGNTAMAMQKHSAGYIHGVNKKSAAFLQRISSKTEKTLARLARWEERIAKLLKKNSPETYEQLFGNNQLTFSKMLADFRTGEQRITEYTGKFNEYRDKTKSTILFLKEHDEYVPQHKKDRLMNTGHQLNKLDTAVQESEFLERMIKDRKQQLAALAMKYLSGRKYLRKMTKECYYFSATLENYKQLFSSKSKREEMLFALAGKIPGYQQFIEENSQLTSLFRLPADYSGTPNLGGLQTRTTVQTLTQNRISAAGSNAMQAVQQNLQQAQAYINKVKEKVSKAGGGSSDVTLPDFVPNNQKSKTFWQRIQFNTDLQTNRGSRFLPNTADVAAGLAFKIDDKKQIGSQLVYKAGLGNGLNHIKLTHQGFGYRFYADLKLKKSFWISGGYENNYMSAFKNITELKAGSYWQTSAVAGLSKKWKLKKKSRLVRRSLGEGGEMKLLYDFLWNKKVGGQRVVFRTGFSF